MSTHDITPRTAAHDLVGYGTIGLELHRARELREREITMDRHRSQLSTSSAPASARQRLGDAIVRLGMTLAGERARMPRVAPGATPRVDAA